MESARKAEWSTAYPDGSDRVIVSYDTTTDYGPRHITIKGFGEATVISMEDAAWVAVRILDAAAAIDAQSSPEASK